MSGDSTFKNEASRDHWNAAYGADRIDGLGWYEEYPEHSIQMLERCAPDSDDLILDIGSGTSTLIPQLLDRGHVNVVAADISDRALSKARDLLGTEKASIVNWVVDDVLQPTALSRLANQVNVWHDRAVFHFLTDESDRQRYLSTLLRLLTPGGYIVIATFSLNGVDRCSGLPVRKYSAESIAEFLGAGFSLLHSFECTYSTPSGEARPYVYTLFRRVLTTES